MKTIRKTVDSQTSFVISGLDPAYHDVVRDLYYSQVEEGFVKTYPADTPHLDRIYRNFERYAEEMILHAARVHPVPWEQALLSFLKIVENENVNWWLTGSAALAVRGTGISPRDLDLVVDGVGAQRLGELLLDYLVEPVLPVQGWICNWFGRAFLHARIEWIGDVHNSVDEPDISDFGPIAASRLEVINWHRKEIRVPPLDLQLEVNKRRGLVERVEIIMRVVNSSG